MPAKLTYLLIDLGAFAVPFIFSFHPKIKFYKTWPAFWLANLMVTIVFLVWDAFFTQMGVWGFTEEYILGPKIMNLPLEEVLFFICIPYASMFTYHCFKKFFPDALSAVANVISVLLIVVLLIVGIFHFSAVYTSVTCLSLTVVLALLLFTRQRWMNTFYLTYAVILIPFFIVNGLLTGTGLDKPVVWYNNTENLGIRLLTIPVEDVFYGMLLLLLNTLFFEKLLRKP